MKQFVKIKKKLTCMGKDNKMKNKLNSLFM